jgi:hypothetical protein
MAIATENIKNDFSVEVNLTGPDLDPAKVTEILGLVPTDSARTGDPRRNGHADATYSEGFWSHELSALDEINQCRDHLLCCLVDKIEPKVDEIRTAGVEKIYFYFTLSSYVGMMNLHFKAETMGKLSKIDADLYVTCFDCFNPKHSFWQEELESSTNEA